VATGLELLRDSYEVFNRDFERIRAGEYERILRYWDPECEIHPFEGWPLDPVYHGYDGYRLWFEHTFELYERVRVDVEQLLPVPGEDRIVALTKVFGRPKGDETELQVEFAQVYDMRDGRVLRQWNFIDRAAGLRHAGLDGTG
jgi:ketosteroid isomerase-like protein